MQLELSLKELTTSPHFLFGLKQSEIDFNEESDHITDFGCLMETGPTIPARENT